MNLLYDAFPETVQVDDVSYAVYTDFRNWLRFFGQHRTIAKRSKI